MTDMLPATRTEADIQTTDTDSWIQVVGDVAKLAGHIAGTEFVPRGLRDNPAAVTAAIMYGREVGLPPMTALTHTHVIEGKPAMSAEAMRALVLAAGHELVVEETNGARCVLTARRRGFDKWTRVEWTLDMARAAGLVGKQVWKSYPRQMLQARATAEIVRLVFPDVIHGFRALEELDETEGSGLVEGSRTTTASSSTVQRKRGARSAPKGEAVALEEPVRPVLEGPPLPGEDGYELTSVVDPVGEADETAPVEEGEEVGVVRPETATSPPPPEEVDQPERPATKPDLRMYQASFTRLEDDVDRDERLAVTCQIIGRIITTSNELSQREARLVADTVSRFKTLRDLYALLDATTDPA